LVGVRDQASYEIHGEVGRTTVPGVLDLERAKPGPLGLVLCEMFLSWSLMVSMMKRLRNKRLSDNRMS
jgi:hypothetical protein